MNFFRRKFDPRPVSRPVPAHNRGHLESATHRVTLELARAETFAAMLAKSRQSQVIEVTDLLAGMYICNWDRLSLYWREEDREEIETFLRGVCRISPAALAFLDRNLRRPSPPGRALARFAPTRETEEVRSVGIIPTAHPAPWLRCSSMPKRSLRRAIQSAGAISRSLPANASCSASCAAWALK